MSLSEIIASLEDNESIKFTREGENFRIVVKKGDHPKNNKTIQFFVFVSDTERCQNTDVFAFEVERTLNNIRKPTA